MASSVGVDLDPPGDDETQTRGEDTDILLYTDADGRQQLAAINGAELVFPLTTLCR